MSPGEIRWLKAAAKTMQSIIEIGSWKGRSTHALASACKGKVYAVDTWLGSPEDLIGPDAPHAEARTGDIYSQFLANVTDCPNVVPIQSESVAAAAVVADADMVFIDASHEYASVKADIDAWFPKSKKLICGHDYNHPGVELAVREAFGGRATVAEGSIWQVWL